MIRTEIFSNQRGSLLTDQQRRRVRVRTKVIWANTQVDTLEISGTIDVETWVDDTTLFSWLHCTSTERVPGGLDVIRDPVVDGLVIIFGVLDVLVHLGSIVRVSGLVPGTHMNANSETVRVDLLRCPDIDILGGSRRRRVEPRMMRCEFTTECYKKSVE